LAKDVGCALSTTKRIVDALIAHNLMEREVRTRNLILGARLRALASDVTLTSLVQLARPVLEGLATSTGEDVALSALHGLDAVFLDRVYGPQPLKIIERSDVRVPLNCGFRRLLLAHQPADWIENYIRRTPLKRFSPTTIVNKSELRSALQEIRERGYLVAYGEYLSDAAGVSAPIFGPQGRLEAVVVVVGPLSRFQDPARVEMVVDLTVKAARRVTELLRAFDTRGHAHGPYAQMSASSQPDRRKAPLERATSGAKREAA
jgi:DNA-binding IclR family transcriptional regulator